MVKLIRVINLNGRVSCRFNSSSVFPENRQPIKTNDLSLVNGEFKDFSMVKLDSNIEWKSGHWSYGSFGAINRSTLVRSKIQNVLNNLSPLQSYSMLLILHTSHCGFLTITKQVILNKETNVEKLHKFILNKIDILAFKYDIELSDTICYKHRPLYVKVKDSTLTTIDPNISKKFMKSKFISSKYMPFSMNLSNYGVLLAKNDDGKFYYQYNKRTKLLVSVINEKCHFVELYNLDNDLILSFEDLMFDTYFYRKIKDKNINMKIDFNFNLILVENETAVNYIKPMKVDKWFVNEILTFDIETFIDENNNFIPYACGFYDGKNNFNYYLTDYESADEMLLECLKAMVQPQYHGYTIYAHNFSRFDSIFIFKLIHNNFNTKFTSKDNKILSLTIKPHSQSKIRLYFKDSLNILVNSLDSLGKSFNVPVKKSIFPYKFVNKNNLEYQGGIPDKHFYNPYDDYSSQYELFKEGNWSLRDETIKYLRNDLISLYQVLNKMNDWLFQEYKINMTKYSTISGISLAIYRTKFLKNDFKIPKLRGNINKNIRSAYYGGAVDVYKPHGYNLYYYDVNSLYPFAMLNDMPVGNPIYSTNSNLKELFGFVKATVTSPDNIKKPILPYKSSKGLIFPTGTWTGWFFSEELKQAQNEFGYQVVVHESYIFQRDNQLFTKFVSEFGGIKEKSTGAAKVIAKLILNSLYGRLGMKNELNKTVVIPTEDAIKIHLAYPVIDNFPLSDQLEYIRYNSEPDKELCNQSGIDYLKLLLKNDNDTPEINSAPGVAAAITAYSRMYMNKLKNIPNNECFYSDTDSIVLEKPLENYEINNKIGNLKLEYPKINEALFISPKLYLLELDDGKLIAKGRGYSGSLCKWDYMQLYNEDCITVIDKRWKQRLNINTITEKEFKINISPQFNKRVKLISQGKWVDTQPLRVQGESILEKLSLVPIP